MQLSVDLRPRRLSEVYGQTSIVKALTLRTKNKDWPHALLFKGATGTGKTTVAQIVAMTINCSDPQIDNNPCGKCASCRSIIEERFDRDTVRMDGGASGKADVIDFAHLADISPFYDKHQVFIIEESDQLSKGAKEAFLKLLEKPLKNVYFILLSMVPDGLSEALQSRCQIYNFWPFMKKDIMLGLQSSLKKLNLWGDASIPSSFFTDTISNISDSCQGSFRKAIQLLDGCLSGKIYDPIEVQSTFGTVNIPKINERILNLVNLRKEFFEDIESVKMEEFFELGYMILSSAAIYKLTGNSKNEYYEMYTKEISEKPVLSKVLKLFDDIFEKSGGYIKRANVISKVYQLYDSEGLLKSKKRIME